ncbi:hypothetical protein [Pseudomonas sp. nanlin1]|uniref:hypothetical protein n=1 Tax=Pseudomonas sp. nanlin1 TaxID=3040605 RepID=UPI00388EC4E5
MIAPFAGLAIALLFSAGLAAEPSPVAAGLLAASDTSNPYNSPIRRSNPNSRQGTAPSTPPVRGVNPQLTNPRPPTLENRGIGNGENLRRAPGSTSSPKSTDNRSPRQTP